MPAGPACKGSSCASERVTTVRPGGSLSRGGGSGLRRRPLAGAPGPEGLGGADGAVGGGLQAHPAVAAAAVSTVASNAGARRSTLAAAMAVALGLIELWLWLRGSGVAAAEGAAA